MKFELRPVAKDVAKDNATATMMNRRVFTSVVVECDAALHTTSVLHNFSLICGLFLKLPDHTPE
jgi:hypothetical protein